MKTLHLVLKRHWFKQIESGKKMVEYREIKPYWETRLETEVGTIRNFEAVEFRNGYRPDSKRIVLECMGISKNTQSGFYEIRLGRILDRD